MSADWSVVRLDEVDGIDVAGVQYLPLRHALDTTGFSINAFRADAGQHLIEDHDELGDNAGRQEELYAVVSGRATFTVGGEEIDAPTGTLVFVRDPGTRRAAVALDAGTVALAIGGRTGTYAPSPFEYSYRAQGEIQRGDAAAAVAIMGEGRAAYPDNHAVLYNLACYEALAGRREEALRDLARAVELEPKARGWAATDSDLESIRDDPAFPR